MAGEMNPIKIVLVGERQTGKTTLCCTYANKTWVNVDYQLKTWPESALDDAKWITKLHQNENGTTGIAISVGLYDTHCTTDQADVFASHCAGTHCYLLCYDVSSEASFQALGAWCDLIARTEKVPKDRLSHKFVLVGLKSDVTDKGIDKKFVMSDQAEAFKDEIGAEFHMQCSAKNNVGVNELFHRICSGELSRRNVGDVGRPCCIVM